MPRSGGHLDGPSVGDVLLEVQLVFRRPVDARALSGVETQELIGLGVGLEPDRLRPTGIDINVTWRVLPGPGDRAVVLVGDRLRLDVERVRIGPVSVTLMVSSSSFDPVLAVDRAPRAGRLEHRRYATVPERRTDVQPDDATRAGRGSVEGVVERAGGADAVFPVEGAHDELAARSLRLEIGPPDDPVAAEQRQHVVPEATLVGRLVDLDQVVEAEHAARERPVPEQVVERGEEHRRGRRRPVELRARRHQHRWPAVVQVTPLEEAVRDERIHDGTDPRSAAPQPPVLDDAALGESPARAHGPERELAQAFGLGRRRRIEKRRIEHALGKVVEALEPLAPGHDQLTVVPEQLEHALRRLPAPHLALPRRTVEVPRPERPTGADLVEDVLPQMRVRPVDLAVPPAPADLHRRAEQRPVVSRQKARLVGPVLDQAPAAEQP